MIIAITNAYGTTEFGGISNMGTVFEIGLTGGLTIIHTFSNLDGAYPCSQLALSGSTFYGISNVLFGTTLGGGSNGFGTVFKLNADGSGFNDLYDFTGGSDGKFPRTGLLIDGDRLFGATSNSIFKINTDGSDFTCITNITNASQLLLSLSGDTLYGTTTNEGSYGGLFSVSTAGTNLTWLHNFTGGNSGAFPIGSLEILECSNTFIGGLTATDVLFGVTYGGGINSNGMVFSVDTDGSGFTDLHDFTGTTDGINPVGGLLLTNNQAPGFGGAPAPYLFGTTSSGGTNNDGTVFGISLDGSSFQTVYNFAGTNGSNPEGKLVLAGQTIYGTTYSGGASNLGTTFSVNIDGSNFSDLHNLSAHGGDGASPAAGLSLPVVDNPSSIWSLDTTLTLSGIIGKYQIAIDDSYALFVNGNLVSNTNSDGVAQWLPLLPLPYLHTGENDIRVVIAGNGDTNDYFAMQIQGYLQLPRVVFGTTQQGGSHGDGTIFEMGYSNDDIILHNFADGQDGRFPIGDLVLSNNIMYGVTEAGGTSGNGTIFRINTDGFAYTNLYSFKDLPDGADPVAGLVLSGNVLYGTTKDGGSNNVDGTIRFGTVFRVNTDGSGYTNLYSFAGGGSYNDGDHPMGSLLLVSNNTLFGTTAFGGSSDANYGGELFSIGTNGANYQIIHYFGTNTDGANPEAGLALSGPTLYGTTLNGGTNGGYGTIFSYDTTVSSYKIVYRFAGAPSDGINPQAGLVLSSGRLYGTTEDGGSNSDGTIFSIGADGNGYTNLLSFGAPDSAFGQNPQADLIIESNLLYGTTYVGGTNNNGNGMAFSINTNGSGFHDIYNFTGNPDGATPDGGLLSP